MRLINTVILLIVFTSLNFVIEGSEKIKLEFSKIKAEILEKNLNKNLRNAIQVSNELLNEKKNSLLKDANILGSFDTLISLVEFSYKRKARILNADAYKSNEKTTGEVKLLFKKSKSRIAIIALLAKLKITMYGNRDAVEHIEIINFKGKNLGRTGGLKKEFKEKTLSKNIKTILSETRGKTLTEIISINNKLLIKAYGVLNKDSLNLKPAGIVITSFPLGQSFIEKLKRITKTEVVLYTREGFATGTFYNKEGNLIKLKDQNDVFKFFERHEEKIVTYTKDEKLNLEKVKQRNYRFIYTPLKNNSGEIIGLLGVSSIID